MSRDFSTLELQIIYILHIVLAICILIASILAIDLVGHAESRFSFSSLSHQNLPPMIVCHLIQPYY